MLSFQEKSVLNSDSSCLFIFAILLTGIPISFIASTEEISKVTSSRLSKSYLTQFEISVILLFTVCIIILPISQKMLLSSVIEKDNYLYCDDYLLTSVTNLPSKFKSPVAKTVTFPKSL